MAENLNDTPARHEENEQYLRDPTSTSAKPYSTKQQAANERHKNRQTLYHAKEGRKVFDKADVEDAMKDGWRDVPFVHPRHPDKKVEAPKETPLLEALRGEAEKMGIKVDNRWSEKRLKDEMLKQASG